MQKKAAVKMTPPTKKIALSLPTGGRKKRSQNPKKLTNLKNNVNHSANKKTPLGRNAFSVENHLSEMRSIKKRDFIEKLRNRIRKNGKDIEEVGLKTQIKYKQNNNSRRGLGFVWLDVRTVNLRVFLRKANYRNIDKFKKIQYEKDKPSDQQGYPELKLHENELDEKHLLYLEELIKHAYKA